MTPLNPDRNDFDRRVQASGIDPRALRDRIDRLLGIDAARYARLWSYYRNPTQPIDPARVTGAARPYRQAQEWGLPARLRGTTGIETEPSTREIVIENDIGWRVDTMVDFLFGRPLTLRSTAPDPRRRDEITRLLRLIFAQHGGLALLQQLAVIGAVHGQVDVLVKLLPTAAPKSHVGGTVSTQSLGETHAVAHPAPAPEVGLTSPAPSDPTPSVDIDEASSHTTPAGSGASDSTSRGVDLIDLARRIRLEVVEPARAVPVLDPMDPRRALAYATVRTSPRETHDVPSARSPWWRRLWRDDPTAEPNSRAATTIELITPHRWMTFHDSSLLATGENALGEIPLAHIQNIADPFCWGGASDVAPLMPLQDELNTRLSDRAQRITLQSFRMYLGKGVDRFTEQPVGPGRMWMSDNPDAEIVEFGGDASCPSEDAHIREIREAMDKLSAVTPIAAGILRHRIGRLTSGAALRVTMLALLSRTGRKRLSYFDGIARICELAMAWLDRAGLFRTSAEERAIAVDWEDPLSSIALDSPS
jgi:hypothetical protein